MSTEQDNQVFEEKRNKPAPLTRIDIADVLASLGLPGENRIQKVQIVKQLCEGRQDGSNIQGHPVWDTLDDFPEF